MRTLLHCGHILDTGDWREFYVCSQCGGQEVKPQAFECREWKVTCGTHRQGRWFGQDHAGAKLWKHARCQGATVDYLQVENLRRQVRAVYGRRVRTIIEDVVTARAWPEVRQVLLPLEGMNISGTVFTGEDEIDHSQWKDGKPWHTPDDVPPF